MPEEEEINSALLVGDGGVGRGEARSLVVAVDDRKRRTIQVDARERVLQVAKNDERAGATIGDGRRPAAGALPHLRILAAIPGAHPVGAHLGVVEPPAMPQRAFRVVRLGIDDDALLRHRDGGKGERDGDDEEAHH